MKNPEEISKDIRDDYFRRYGAMDALGFDENTLDTLIVGAVSPLCQRIDVLTNALREALESVRPFGRESMRYDDYTRLESILGEMEGGSK